MNNTIQDVFYDKNSRCFYIYLKGFTHQVSKGAFESLYNKMGALLQAQDYESRNINSLQDLGVNK